MDHRPQRHDEHEHHRDDEKPDRATTPPQVKRDHEKRQPGEQLVGRAEERPEDEPTLAGVGDAPLGSAWRHGGHGCGDDDGKDRCAMLVLQHGKRVAAERGGQFLHDVALQTAGGIKRRAGERRNEHTHQRDRYSGGQAKRLQEICRAVYKRTDLGPKRSSGTP